LVEVTGVIGAMLNAMLQREAVVFVVRAEPGVVGVAVEAEEIAIAAEGFVAAPVDDECADATAARGTGDDHSGEIQSALVVVGPPRRASGVEVEERDGVVVVTCGVVVTDDVERAALNLRACVGGVLVMGRRDVLPQAARLEPRLRLAREGDITRKIINGRANDVHAECNLSGWNRCAAERISERILN
jgi:hypothetical protein